MTSIVVDHETLEQLEDAGIRTEARQVEGSLERNPFLLWEDRARPLYTVAAWRVTVPWWAGVVMGQVGGAVRFQLLHAMAVDEQLRDALEVALATTTPREAVSVVARAIMGRGP